MVVALAKAVKQSGAFADAWQSLKGICTGVFDIIKLVFDLITDLIIDALGPTIQFLRIVFAWDQLLITVIEAILNIIKGVIKLFKNMVKWIPGVNLVAQAVDGIVNALKNATNWLKENSKKLGD